jgi:hypothetical protein
MSLCRWVRFERVCLAPPRTFLLVPDPQQVAAYRESKRSPDERSESGVADIATTIEFRIALVIECHLDEGLTAATRAAHMVIAIFLSSYLDGGKI